MMNHPNSLWLCVPLLFVCILLNLQIKNSNWNQIEHFHFICWHNIRSYRIDKNWIDEKHVCNYFQFLVPLSAFTHSNKRNIHLQFNSPNKNWINAIHRTQFPEQKKKLFSIKSEYRMANIWLTTLSAQKKKPNPILWLRIFVGTKPGEAKNIDIPWAKSLLCGSSYCPDFLRTFVRQIPFSTANWISHSKNLITIFHCLIYIEFAVRFDTHPFAFKKWNKQIDKGKSP